jgi:hypothetical protein
MCVCVCVFACACVYMCVCVRVCASVRSCAHVITTVNLMYGVSTVFKKLCMDNMSLTTNLLWLLKTFLISSNNIAVLHSCEVRVTVAQLKTLSL